MTTIPLHHILLKSPLLAEDILKELNLGARFEDLAAEHSACPSGANKGFAGHHDIDELPEAMIQAMQTYDGSSAWIGPINTPYGYHIIRPAGQIGDIREKIDDVGSHEHQSADKPTVASDETEANPE